MITIIRVEHTNGWGLWRARLNNNDNNSIIESLDCFQEILDRHSNMPSVKNDPGLGSRDDNEFCAWGSINEFDRWMDRSWIPELVENGFKILLIEVSECRVGKYQVVFKKENVLQTKDITSLFLIIER